MKRSTSIVSCTLVAYSIAVVIVFSLMATLTRDLLTGLGVCISVVSWWGWVFRLTNKLLLENQLALSVLGVSIPIIISLLLNVILLKYARLGKYLKVYISVVAYYVVGTIYFILSNSALDVNLPIALLIWLLILAISTHVANTLLR